MTDYQRIEKVIRHIDRHYHDQPTLAQLARVAGLSEFHFHRLFHRWAGTTPKNFIQFLTATHAKNLLRESRDVMGAALEAGLSGPSRLHDLMVSIDALTPGEYKRGGEGVEIRYGIHETPFGPGLLGITPRGICHLSLGSVEDPERELRARWPRATFVADARSTARAMSGIFAAKPTTKHSLLLRGTPFQLKVWEALLRIPPGGIVAYSEIARAIGSSRAVRAVGTAVGANPVAFLIPCHRVLRETGALGGYRWGLDRKKAILAWETS